jgi:hypothetical protein
MRMEKWGDWKDGKFCWIMLCAHIALVNKIFHLINYFEKKKSMLWLKDRIKLEQIESAVSWKDLLKNIIREKFKIYPIKG